MATVREAWTDERLDDLNDRVAEIGRRMDEGFERVNAEIRPLRVEVDAKLDATRNELKAEIVALQRLILQVGGGLIVTPLAAYSAWSPRSSKALRACPGRGSPLH